MVLTSSPKLGASSPKSGSWWGVFPIMISVWITAYRPGVTPPPLFRSTTPLPRHVPQFLCLRCRRQPTTLKDGCDGCPSGVSGVLSVNASPQIKDTRYGSYPKGMIPDPAI